MNRNKNPNSGAVIVSWDFRDGDQALVLVGKNVKGNIEIINAFTGDEAHELHAKLTTPADALAKEVSE